MNTLLRSPLPKIMCALALLAALLATSGPPAAAAPGTTAWQNGTFVVDTPNLVRRSDVVLGRANAAPAESMPLGNGALGAAVWAANGFTAQLNRTDTFPDRKSPGSAGDPGPVPDDQCGRLQRPARPVRRDAAPVRRRDDDDRVRSRGHPATRRRRHRRRPEHHADRPGQSVERPCRRPHVRRARSPRSPKPGWTTAATGASGRTFGSLAGVTAGGRNVVASAPNRPTAQVSFQPNTDGSFRVSSAAPTWTGGDSIATTNSVLNGATTRPQAEVRGAHLQWWHDYGQSAGLIKVTSADGTGDYIENLRTLYLYSRCRAEQGRAYPARRPASPTCSPSRRTGATGSRPATGSGTCACRSRRTCPPAYRAQRPGVPALYRDNLGAITTWTQQHMPGRQGICVPETMRFNGNGTYNGGIEQRLLRVDHRAELELARTSPPAPRSGCGSGSTTR